MYNVKKIEQLTKGKQMTGAGFVMGGVKNRVLWAKMTIAKDSI